jgi:oxalate decarboxylase/phosphoglucose isomerase-like protein (cupin superfamily)
MDANQNKFSYGEIRPREFEGGTLRGVTKDNFPVLQGLAFQFIDLEAGAVREPHIHPNAAQLDIALSGRARVGIVGPGDYDQLLELEPGDMAFTPQGYLHWIENIGREPLRFGLLLSNEQPETIELSEMLSGTSGEILTGVLGLPENLLERIPGTAVTIGTGSGRG